MAVLAQTVIKCAAPGGECVIDWAQDLLGPYRRLPMVFSRRRVRWFDSPVAWTTIAYECAWHPRRKPLGAAISFQKSLEYVAILGVNRTRHIEIRRGRVASSRNDFGRTEITRAHLSKRELSLLPRSPASCEGASRSTARSSFWSSMGGATKSLPANTIASTVRRSKDFRSFPFPH